MGDFRGYQGQLKMKRRHPIQEVEQQRLYSSERKWKFLLDFYSRTHSSINTSPQSQGPGRPHEAYGGLPCKNASGKRPAIHRWAEGNVTQDNDPFDCSCLNFPPTYEIVDDIANDFIVRWKQLDDRRLDGHAAMGLTLDKEKATDFDVIEDEDEACHYSRRRKRMHTDCNQNKTSWFSRHIRLPSGFDLTTSTVCTGSVEGQEYDPHNERLSTSSRDYVVSLRDPGEYLLYSAELKDLINDIPSLVEDLEPTLSLRIEHSNSLCSSTNSRDFGKADNSKMQRMLHITMQSLEGTGFSSVAHSYDWSRIRAQDRHDFDRTSHCEGSLTFRTAQNGKKTDPTHLAIPIVSSIRFECLLQQMKLGSSPDPHRMILEFSGNQTLWDVHKSIISLVVDPVWDDMIRLQESANHEAQLECVEPDAPAEAKGAARLPPRGRIRNNSLESSGFFFIEGTFYVAGPVDYFAPIFQWLYEGKSNYQCIKRAAQLGLDASFIAKVIGSKSKVGEPLQDGNYSNLNNVYDKLFPTMCYPNVKAMNKTFLRDLKCRLLVRYLHVYHGDVESSIFVTDHKISPIVDQAILASQKFPIIHDIYTTSFNIPDCEVCNYRPAVVATSTTACGKSYTKVGVNQTQSSQTIGLFGHHVLCERCARTLSVARKLKGDVQCYSILRSHLDLSTGSASRQAF